MIVSLRWSLVACLISVAAVAWCNSRVELFGVTYNDGVEQATLAVREHPGQRPENEGYIVPEINSTPTYSLAEPLLPGDESQQFAVTIVGDGGWAVVEIIGLEDEVIATREVAAAGATPIPRSVALLVPPGRRVSGFRIAGEAPGPGSQSPFRVVGAEIGPPKPGVAEIADSNGGRALLATGPEIRVVAWGAPVDAPPAGDTSTDGGSTDGAIPGRLVWSFIIDGSSFWHPHSVAEISYRFSPPSVGEYAPWEDGRFPVASLEVGALAYELRLRPGNHSVFVHPTSPLSEPETLVIQSSEKGFSVGGVRPTDAGGRDSTSPIPADLSTLIDYPQRLWRQGEYEVFQWSLYPGILVVDSADYAVQSRFFKRLAFFTEKVGFRGEILSDEQMAGRHGYNAHNYSGEGLAAFFSAAATSRIALHDEEILLRDLALRHGIIVSGDGEFAAGSGGVLGVSRQSDEVPGLRRLLLTHEAYHGVYYADPDYVEAVAALWGGLSDDERQFWRLYLSGLQYDVSDPYLLQNEYHAYLLQQPVGDVSWLYNVRAQQRLRTWFPNSSPWIDRFYSERTDTIVNQAIALNEALFAATGLVGGDVFCLTPSLR